MEYNEILKRIDKAIAKFNKAIPAAQQDMLDEIMLELKRLDLRGGKIKTTVANLRVINSIKNKMQKLILTDGYKSEAKAFMKSFNEVTQLQNEYWKSIEPTFKPKALLKQISKQAIGDTVKKLTQSGIVNGIEDKVANILRSNITTGGSYKDLQKQLSSSLTGPDGAMIKNVRQVTVDSLNTFTAQYTQAISNDLGYEWFAWQGSEIMTSRPFCQAMVENNRYFHISQVPNLLKGLDALGEKLTYTDNETEEILTVEIYKKTGLPHGFIAGTNTENFFINRGGYLCGHQPRPVSEFLVKNQASEVYEIVIGTAAYKAWKRIHP